MLTLEQAKFVVKALTEMSPCTKEDPLFEAFIKARETICFRYQELFNKEYLDYSESLNQAKAEWLCNFLSTNETKS